MPDAVQARIPATLVKGGKVPAAWFLEKIGAKGFTRGGIHVADYHANLIYNAGSGQTADLVILIDELKRRVASEFKFVLQEEVQYVGFPNRASQPTPSSRRSL